MDQGGLSRLHVERSEVVGDEVIALDAAFRGGPGILQIAGTGTNCIGRAPDGGRETAGGWSSRLGDEGSGYWIGLHAVRRALHAYDRGEPTRILDVVGCAWGTATLDELVNLGDSTPSPDFAALAPDIDRLAEEGDAVALGVLNRRRQTWWSRFCWFATSCDASTMSRPRFPWPGLAV